MIQQPIVFEINGQAIIPIGKPKSGRVGEYVDNRYSYQSVSQNVVYRACNVNIDALVCLHLLPFFRQLIRKLIPVYSHEKRN